MTLAPGLFPVPKGHLAAVVTYLEMTAPAIKTPRPFPSGIVAVRETLGIDDYRTLFRAIGAPWLWSSRLRMDDGALAAILNDAAVEIWIIRQNDTAIGLVELDFRTQGACELAFFGLVADETGQGLGGPMMALAQARAFSHDIKRFHVHTCTLDAPAALAFYQKSGFVPYKVAVEIFADPRLSGALPSATASHIPCLP